MKKQKKLNTMSNGLSHTLFIKKLNKINQTVKQTNGQTDLVLDSVETILPEDHVLSAVFGSLVQHDHGFGVHALAGVKVIGLEVA